MKSGSTARLGAIDAHVAGGVVRLVTSGLSTPRGGTMTDKAGSLGRRTERLCGALLRDPRGHDAITMALLTEPAEAASDAGVLFRRAHGLLPFSGEGLIAVATVAIERRLIVSRHGDELRLDTQAGPVDLICHVDRQPSGEGRVRQVRYIGPPAFVLGAGVELRAGARRIRADVAFGGEFFAVVDAESAGLSLTPANLAGLQSAAIAVAGAIQTVAPPVHPTDAVLSGLGGVLFTGPAAEGEACLRGVVVRADTSIDRAPTATALVSAIAVLHAMGLMTDGDTLDLESLFGARTRGRVLSSTRVSDRDAVAVQVEGAAWIVADHEFVLAHDDPLRFGVAAHGSQWPAPGRQHHQ